jgi:hypothetical protein
MLNPKVVPLPRPKLLNPGSDTEQPRAFRFGVTWETLFAGLEPVEITESIPTALAVVVAPPVVVIPSHALQVVEPPPRQRTDEAAWEMVVPKMVRH